MSESIAHACMPRCLRAFVVSATARHPADIYGWRMLPLVGHKKEESCRLTAFFLFYCLVLPGNRNIQSIRMYRCESTGIAYDRHTEAGLNE